MCEFYDAAPAEEVPAGGLNWIIEQVVAHQAGEACNKVHGELLGEQLGAQVISLAVCDVSHPLLSLDAELLPGPESRTLTVSKWSQKPLLTNSDGIAVPSAPFCQALRSWNDFPPLPSSPLE